MLKEVCDELLSIRTCITLRVSWGLVFPSLPFFLLGFLGFWGRFWGIWWGVCLLGFFNSSLHLLRKHRNFLQESFLTIFNNLYFPFFFFFFEVAFISCAFISFFCVLTIVNGRNREPWEPPHISFPTCPTSIFDLAPLLEILHGIWHHLRELLRLMWKNDLKKTH